MVKKLLRNNEGNVMVIVAASMIVLLGMAAFSIDIGYIYTAKNQLQTAADASALAGASGLLYNQAEATNRAIQFAGLNTCINEPVALSAADISFPSAERIYIQANRNLDLFFGRVIGIEQVAITAVAEAEIGVLGGVGGLKPWAIPDLNYPLGAPVILKAGELGAPGTASGFFYPVDFPPLYSPTTGESGDPISGAQEYGDNIMYGADDPIFVGDELLVEPGNMIGPTAQGIQYLIDQDPNAYWYSDGDYGQNGGFVSDSDYEGFTSPRIVKIPFYDPEYPPDSGRNTVVVIRLGAFFVEGVQGRNVIGRFMEITAPGFGDGTSSLIKDVRLTK